MAKTGKQIQGDIRRMLRESPLASAISGEVYRNGLRPRDSRQEDAVVTLTTGTPDEVQEGVVTINIFVPDTDPYDNGVMVEDTERTEELESLADEWVKNLSAAKSSYKFRLLQTIYTEEEEAINQHFVVIKLHYRYYNGE